MHLPFNEAFLKVVRTAFPDKRLLFSASQGHIDNLTTNIGQTEGIDFVPIAPLSAPPGKSLHHPWTGRPAARTCLAEAEQLLAGKRPDLAVLCGMDANLLAVFRKAWFVSVGAPLHYVLHNQLSAAMAWRSRNPIVRAFDFSSAFAKPLPSGQSILVLELGLATTIQELFPVHRGRVLTLEHPVVEEEAADPTAPNPSGPLRIGFCGHCGRGKGFDIFVELANEFAGRDFEFHAIGLANPNASDLDLARLARKPSPTPLPRSDYLAAMRAVDLICLPLRPGAGYVASGSIVDAISALKPLLLVANQMHFAIHQKYGDFGILFEEPSKLRSFFANTDRRRLKEDYSGWVKNIARIRESRDRQHLAQKYADLVMGS